MNSPSNVTTRQVFAIAGPAMIANLTTPLIGIVSTTAIGRLGDATLLGGVAMASVLFDCMFWLFAFLRMGTVAFTAQSLGAGEARELRAILVRGFIVAAPVAVRLGAGFVPVRKAGKLPWHVHIENYELEYRVDSLEIHRDALHLVFEQQHVFIEIPAVVVPGL